MKAQSSAVKKVRIILLLAFFIIITAIGIICLIGVNSSQTKGETPKVYVCDNPACDCHTRVGAHSICGKCFKCYRPQE